MTSANPDRAVPLVLSLIALVLGGVGAFQGFRNAKQIEEDASVTKNLTAVMTEDNDTFAALGERLASLEKQLRGGVGAELDDPTQELLLVRRDLQELGKRVNTGQKDELELRAALNQVITRLEETVKRVQALENAPRPASVEQSGPGETIEKR
jgi:hypothetical protein